MVQDFFYDTVCVCVCFLGSSKLFEEVGGFLKLFYIGGGGVQMTFLDLSRRNLGK